MSQKTHIISESLNNRTYIISFDSVDEIGVFKDYQFVEKMEDLIVSYDYLKIMEKIDDESDEKEKVFSWRTHDTPLFNLLHLLENSLVLIDNYYLHTNNRLNLMYDDQLINVDYNIGAYLSTQNVNNDSNFSEVKLNIYTFPVGLNYGGQRISLSVEEIKLLIKLIKKYYNVKIDYYNSQRTQLKEKSRY